mmetsp:Transcript_7226/g.14251  ORF Transcript_7226/g.14251 Transcript_7226/m.14251 type:complete len:253 (-) Transcript_7226:156-914(-)
MTQGQGVLLPFPPPSFPPPPPFTRLRGGGVPPSARTSLDASPLRLIITGAPASGKGTQCSKITKAFGCKHLSTGDMLRQAVADGTEVGKAAKEYMDAGELVPDSVVIGIIKDVLKGMGRDEGFLLDGFPRTLSQAESLNAVLEETDFGGVDKVIYLDVDAGALVERVTGRRVDPETGDSYHVKFNPCSDPTVASRLVQRSDDTEEKVLVRLAAFKENVDAVNEAYGDKVVRVDGNRAVEDVWRDIREVCEGI